MPPKYFELEQEEVDLSNVSLADLVKEINKRKETRVPELVDIINKSIQELISLNCTMHNDSESDFTLKGVYLDDVGTIYYTELQEEY